MGDAGGGGGGVRMGQQAHGPAGQLLWPGGWHGYTWEGVHHVAFVFRRASGDPAADTTCCIHAAEAKGAILDQSRIADFAGIVCMPD
jgi:hypothetical protein